ncbi:MAG: antibiotic biosynthesis monooxygenase [Comamonadaceae bacterium]|nr:antibiotic biosynthesis monooxygenase [Comamonadaceae bacterium]
MIVVIFRAKTRQLGADYAVIAARMRELALRQFGCLAFDAVTQGQEEIALSYWPDEASVHAWKSHAEHVLAQQLGRERWYESYVVQVAHINREYRFEGMCKRP